jgi:hypothetical protein
VLLVYVVARNMMPARGGGFADPVHQLQHEAQQVPQQNHQPIQDPTQTQHQAQLHAQNQAQLQIQQPAQSAPQQQAQEALSTEDAEGEAVNAQPQLEIPLPPPSRQFKTYQELLDTLQTFFRNNGAALVTARSAKAKTVNGVRVPSIVSLICDRGKLRPPRGKGLRKTSTTKTGCPFKITASFKVSENSSWVYRIVEPTHNHFQSAHPSAHIVHRRRTPAQRALAATLSKFPALSAQDVADAIKDLHQNEAFFTVKDLYNDRQALKKSLAKSDTQAGPVGQPPQLQAAQAAQAVQAQAQAGLAEEQNDRQNQAAPVVQQPLGIATPPSVPPRRQHSTRKR